MKILAIESSCDETSAAVVTNDSQEIQVLSHITATSLDMHATTGGIIPENAARMQVKYILPVIIQALIGNENTDTHIENVDDWKKARKILKDEIDAIAVTFGPGLIGSLLVGVETAKTLAYAFDKPIIPVNHLLAHIYANFISTPSLTRPSYSEGEPFIGLIVSGGHSDLLLFRSHTDYQWLGGTRDDAAGEAFDKIGRILGLPYPAGPEIERRANLVQEPTVTFKSPILNEDNFDFSFSGLKSEAMRFVQKNPDMEDKLKNEICYATQKAILDVLIKKTIKAAEKYNSKTILVGGGVSANKTFTRQLQLAATHSSLNPEIYYSEKIYCTDNAAMIGAYALTNPQLTTWKNVQANPNLYFS